MEAKVQLEFGNLHPLDESAGESADWMHSAARGVVAMMQDNAEIEAILNAMDEATRAEFVSGMSDIIREASSMENEVAEEVPAPDAMAE